MTIEIIKVNFSCPMCGCPEFFQVISITPEKTQEDSHHSCSGCSIVFIEHSDQLRKFTKINLQKILIEKNSPTLGSARIELAL